MNGANVTKTPPKFPQLDDVPGAVILQVIFERMPCGTGVTSRWVDDKGMTLRQDFTAFVTRGVSAGGGVHQPQQAENFLP